MTETRPVETNSGTVTEWLPVTTAYSAPAECSGLFLAHGDIMTGYPLVAFDPNIGLYVNTTLRCLPPQATAWWTQAVLGLSGTTTLLGPFTCPEAYTTATTSVVNTRSTVVACCPSDYEFIDWQPNGVANQCTSILSTNQAYTYANQTAYQEKYAVVTFSLSTPMEVTAVQVNGYIFNGISSTGTLSSTFSSSTPLVTSTLNSELKHKTGNGTVSSGVVIGIAVGAVVFGIAVSFIIGWFILRRYRRRAFQDPQRFGSHFSENQLVSMKGSNPANELATVEGAQELSVNQTAHELHGSQVSRL